MTMRRPIVLLSGKSQQLATPTDIVYGAGPVWNGTTRYERAETLTYFGSGTSDGNGRCTFNLTADGTAGGTALFSAIWTVTPTFFGAPGGATGAAHFFWESVAGNLKTVTVRGTSGLVLLVLGATVVFAGSGLTVKVAVQGLSA